eukprot:COSAG01_NODE_73034_length_251_cov_0.769737_1_plen_42_part_10
MVARLVLLSGQCSIDAWRDVAAAACVCRYICPPWGGPDLPPN